VLNDRPYAPQKQKKTKTPNETTLTLDHSLSLSLSAFYILLLPLTYLHSPSLHKSSLSITQPPHHPLITSFHDCIANPQNEVVVVES